jgi:hypothetical protein
LAALRESRRAGRWLLPLAVAWALAPAPASPRSSASEVEVKAAFLVHFAGLVAWPQDAFGAPDAPLRIGVLGADALGEALAQAVRGRSVDAHPLHSERLGDAAEARGAHIVFVGDADRAAQSALLSALRGSSVLTVGETPGFAARGGVINFIVKDSKIHFEINPRAAERARLQISSRLLGLARIVGEDGG